MNNFPVVGSLHFYPIKSCRAIDLSTASVGPRGLMSGKIGDRSWMVVDAVGTLVSQRQKPEMARVKIELLRNAAGITDRMRLSAEGQEPLILDPSLVGSDRQKIMLHGKESIAHTASPEINRWFSGFLGADVTVVHQKESDLRLCDPHFAVNPGVDAVGFGDEFPYLVTTSATLEKLNGFLDSPVPMSRFRPNIVIVHTQPEAEYTWKNITLGSAALSLVKPCARCVMTTIDQDTGIKTGKQPLATLAATQFLAQDFGGERVQGAIFGENAVSTICGEISVGDAVSVVETKPLHNFIRRTPKRAP
ncbi:MAG: MOSC N-terminal beta barrel domain-containing protein [Alphaproteobacteria bacterium]